MKWLSGVEAPAANPEDLSLIPGDPHGRKSDLILLSSAHCMPFPPLLIWTPNK